MRGPLICQFPIKAKTKTITDLLNYLRCPITGDDLVKTDGKLVSINHPEISYPIVDGVIDFIGKSADYDEHWEQFSDLEASTTKLNQAKDFVKWIDSPDQIFSKKRGIVLDVGCGDGNHIPFFPDDWLKIAIDYSTAVNLVHSRYKNTPNLYVIRADAAKLPFKDSIADVLISYGCINCMPDPTKGVAESCRVLGEGGILALWGYGTKSFFIAKTINLVRKLAKFLKIFKLQGLLSFALIPALLFIPSNTGISPKKNSIKECMEIISTNLSPDFIHVLYSWNWKDLVSPKMRYLKDYKNYCGQLFRKDIG